MFCNATEAIPQPYPTQIEPESNTATMFSTIPYTPQANDVTKLAAASTIIGLTGDTSDSDDTEVEVVIGILLMNGRFKCPKPACNRRSFGRQAELRRHYGNTHLRKQAFWCKVISCDRSHGLNHHPFHRKDKLVDHVRAMHRS
jgi:hypothetical protein